MAVVDFHSLDAMKKKEMIFRDIYKSEELKLDSSRSKILKRTLDDLQLCVNDSTEFDEVFRKVCGDVIKIRKENPDKGTKEPLLQQMFRYQAETLPDRLKFSKQNVTDSGGFRGGARGAIAPSLLATSRNIIDSMY